MVSVDLDKIITAQALQEHLESILFEVEEDEKLFVITKKGRPRAALINVDYLEEITGRSVQNETTEYDRYDKVPTKSDEATASEPIAPTAGAPNRIEPAASGPILTPTETTNDTPSTAPTPPPAEPDETTPTPVEPVEPELDLPELSIDDLAFDEEPTEQTPVEQTTAASTPVETATTALAVDASPTALAVPPVADEPITETPPAAEPAGYSVPQLSTLLEDPGQTANDAIQLNIPETPTESPEDWANTKMPVPPTPVEQAPTVGSTTAPQPAPPSAPATPPEQTSSAPVQNPPTPVQNQPPQ